ncbi:RNA polymerase sigma factor [Dictyobacter aurantiacus]|uniref:RNA polymerase sigma24 factor n=1 Tax=Dictyobacter aurantiacus TaxID=1936993 RepID=A0A401ZAL7_9CHLR|nr:RNA polymerase sigma factor [Dictyobacter aurantiacus]GCE03895.1 RNA polymerase sigma24 factor [Dictyobacter aurantiacus]
MEALRDEQLMSDALAGDQGALNILIKRHYGPLLGYLYRLVHGDRQLAEDAVQETFLRMLQRGGYQTGHPFKPWLYTIATNIIRDYFKSAQVKHGADATDEILLTVYDPAPGPEDAALSDEQGQIISLALDTIAEEYRSTISLRFYAGPGWKEIAQVLAGNHPRKLSAPKASTSHGSHSFYIGTSRTHP